MTTNEKKAHATEREVATVSRNTYDSNIDEWDTKWTAGETVTWKIEQTSPDFERQYDVHRIFALAFMAWRMQIKDIKFRSLRRSTAKADIPITFLPKKDDALFKERPGVLAYAYFPTSNPIGGDMVYNDDYIWTSHGEPVSAHKIDPLHYPADTTVKFRTYNLQHTATHELGHALGLRHAQNCRECVMYPFYNGQVEPQPYDVERIQGFYGKRFLPAWLVALLIFKLKRGWLGRH